MRDLAIATQTMGAGDVGAAATADRADRRLAPAVTPSGCAPGGDSMTQRDDVGAGATAPPAVLSRLARSLPRGAVVAIAALAALRLFLPPFPLAAFGATVLAWVGLAGGAGLALAPERRRVLLPAALVLAALPLAGRRYTVATGPEYLTYGEDGVLTLVLTGFLAGLGLLGLALGLAAGRRLTAVAVAALPTRPRTAAALVPLATLALMLGAAALDVRRGRPFLRAPSPIAVPRRSEAEVRAAAAGLGFVVYAAPPEEGAPTAALRRGFNPPGIPPIETVTLIYCDGRCRRASEVQIESAPAAYARVRAPRLIGATPIPPGGKPVPDPPTSTLAVAGVTWQLAESGPLTGSIEADGILGDTLVTIRAPDRAHFARVAAALRLVAP